MAYFCVDCEASGPVPPLYNLLSIGVCVVREQQGVHALGATLYLELKPIFPGFDPVAMGALRLAWRDTSKENLQAILGLPPQDLGRTHRADYDASYQAGILKALLDRRV